MLVFVDYWGLLQTGFVISDIALSTVSLRLSRELACLAERVVWFLQLVGVVGEVQAPAIGRCARFPLAHPPKINYGAQFLPTTDFLVGGRRGTEQNVRGEPG